MRVNSRRYTPPLNTILLCIILYDLIDISDDIINAAVTAIRRGVLCPTPYSLVFFLCIFIKHTRICYRNINRHAITNRAISIEIGSKTFFCMFQRVYTYCQRSLQKLCFKNKNVVLYTNFKH